MATEVSVTGNKKVETLMKEFNAKFPFIRLGVFPPEAKDIVAKGGTIRGVDTSLTIAKVRTKTAPGDITITGNKQVGNLEREFFEIFGLYVQVCYTTAEGKRYYTTGADDKLTLTAFNKKCEENKCKKDEWK